MTTLNPVSAVNAELSRLNEILSALGRDDIDPETLIGLIEGETNLSETLFAITESALEDEAMAAAVQLRIKDLQERKSRLERAAETKYAIVQQAMERAGIDKPLRGVSATLSLGKGRAKVEINDESLIPSRFFVPQDPTLDRAALKAALEANENVPGASLSSPTRTLIVRVR